MSAEDTEESAPGYVDGQMIDVGFATRLMWAPWDGRTNKAGEYIGPAFVSTTTGTALILGNTFFFLLFFLIDSLKKNRVLVVVCAGLCRGGVSLLYATGRWWKRSSGWFLHWRYRSEYLAAVVDVGD